MADYQYLDDTGVIVADTADLLTTVQNEYKAAFGSDLVVTSDTPQGVLITAETLARDSVVRNNAALANQINPNIAGGVFLDAICALTGLLRDAATRSTVMGDLTGVAGTLIPAGVRAKTAANAIFESTGDVVIQSDGTASVAFQSVDYGPVAAPTGTLTQIVDAVLGWETITNPDSAALGQNEQSDLNLRALRKQTLAIQGTALAEAIISGVMIVDGVKSMTFRENVAATTQTIDGVSMIAHSVYACVDGGTDANVAAALLANKSCGAGWNGSTTVNVTEAASGQVYVVKFSRPTAIPIFVETTVKATSPLIDPITATKNAIVAYASGEMEGENGLTVGQDVSPFELSGAVNRQYPNIYVQDLKIKIGGGSFAASQIAIAISEIATISSADITVTVA